MGERQAVQLDSLTSTGRQGGGPLISSRQQQQQLVLVIILILELQSLAFF